MRSKKKVVNNNFETQDDATLYGEFIPSYFNWITIKEQKEKAEKLDNMTKKNKGNN